MKWENAADAAIKERPFSERRKVRTRAEAAALKAGRDVVTMADVESVADDYVADITIAPEGFRLEVCSGKGRCPNRAHGEGGDGSGALVERIRGLLVKEDLGGFLKQEVKGTIRPHHAFSVSLSDCPNACSQPQIKDVGIIAAATPVLTDRACIMCGSCENVCREYAVSVDTCGETPVIDREKCISCGKCIAVCPTGKIDAGMSGYRVMIGGKLGRHPRLADVLPGIHDDDMVLFIVKWCVGEYKKKSTRGKRFAEIVAESDGAIFTRLKADIQKEQQQ